MNETKQYEDDRAFLAKQFGRKLHRLIHERGWNRSDLARRAGLGRDMVAKYVRGDVYPTLATLERLAEALGVSVDVLFVNHSEAQIFQIPQEGTFKLMTDPNDATKVLIELRKRVSVSVGLKIAELLSSDDTSD